MKPKEIRGLEALRRKEERDMRSSREQLELLDFRGMRAKKERTRLENEIHIKTDPLEQIRKRYRFVYS